MAHKIFIIKEGGLKIADELILANKWVKKIIEQNYDEPTKFKGGGNRAIQELSFVYYMADYNSPLNRHGYDTAEAITKAKEKLGLPLTWKPNEIVNNAIDEYREHQSNVSTDTILELLKAFRLYKDVVSKVRASLAASLKVDKLSKSEATSMTNEIGYLIELSKELPKVTRDLKKAIRELESEDSVDMDKIRGTDEAVPRSADPELG